MVVFDSTILLPLLSPSVPPPVDPATGLPVTDFRARVDHLVATLEKQRAKILVPSPALSEILVKAGGAAPAWLSKIKSTAVFRTVPFDDRAAVELAIMTRTALDGGDKRGGGEGSWAKIKFDRQIVAIAKVEGASTIYSDDKNVHRFGSTVARLTVVRLSELPLPSSEAQGSLRFEGPAPDAEGEAEEPPGSG